MAERSWFWVTFPGFKKIEIVHNKGCAFYGKGEGRGLMFDELKPQMKDCGRCKGASNG